jgi:hypothetical protein
VARRTEGASALSRNREAVVTAAISIAGLGIAAAGIVVLALLAARDGGYWLVLIISAMLPLALIAAVCWKVMVGVIADA